jgi:tetratricopeptide (TPR) repeat protein
MKCSDFTGAFPRGARRKGVVLVVLTCLASACAVAPPQPTVLAEANFNGEAAVAAVRAAAGGAARELDVQPIRDPQVEDLRQQAAQLERARKYAEAAAALDQALQINAADPALLQERAEAALLQHRLDDAERYAQKAFDSGSQVGPLCRRHWATIAQVRQAKLDGVGAAMKLAQKQEHYDALVPQRSQLTEAKKQAQAKIDVCTVAAPARY